MESEESKQVFERYADEMNRLLRESILKKAKEDEEQRLINESLLKKAKEDEEQRLLNERKLKKAKEDEKQRLLNESILKKAKEDEEHRLRELMIKQSKEDEERRLLNHEENRLRDPEDSEEYKCSGNHTCNENCDMFHLCGETCRKQITEDHVLHDCNIPRCPCQCLFNDGNKCKHTDHFHDKICEKVEHPKTGEMVNFHICGKKHNCMILCSSEGICDTRPELIRKLFKDEYNEFYYNYIDLIKVRNSCKHILDSEMLRHDDIHICNSRMHYCPVKCPDCNVICDLEVGHSGFHKSDSHRNKDNKIFISKDKTFELVHEELTERQAKTSTYRFNAGESASPEICDQSCSRRSRGHSHPVLCKGGAQCLEVTHKNHALHSKTPLYLSKQG